MCSWILSSWENGIPLNKLFTLGGRLFNQSKGKHVLKRAERHRCYANTLGILAFNFSMFLKFSKGFTLKNRVQKLNGMTASSQKKFLKIIEHVSYSIRYCKISLLIYTGNSSLSNTGLAVDSSGIYSSHFTSLAIYFQHVLYAIREVARASSKTWIQNVLQKLASLC